MLKRNYIQFMQKYANSGHVSQVSQPNDKHCYYLSHYGVFNTNEVRVMFNCSCLTDSAVFLNDYQHVCPIIQYDLFLTTIRFKFHRFILEDLVECTSKF